MYRFTLTFKLFLSVISIFFSLTAVQGQETYLDRFNAVSYANNNGTNNFSNNWTERNDDNAGSPTAGKIRVNSNQLRFRNLDETDIIRFVPLAGASAVNINTGLRCYCHEVTKDYEYIYYNADTSTFNLIATLNSTNTGSITYELSAAEIASNPAIFINGLDNAWGNNETIFIDNVQFATVPAAPEATKDFFPTTVDEVGEQSRATISIENPRQTVALQDHLR